MTQCCHPIDQDLRHGFGEFEVSPGVSYCGQFEHGEMHGALYISEIHSSGVVKTMPARAEKVRLAGA